MRVGGHVLDNVKGSKKKPRWIGPVRVLRFSASRNSVWVQVIHDDVKEMKVYVRGMDGEERGCAAEVTHENTILS